MMRIRAALLQALIVMVGLASIGILLFEPHVEGRNAHATVAEIYFHDPFLAYAYFGSISFFVVLYQAFKLAGYAGQGNLFSQDAVRSLRIIKYSAMLMVGFVAGGEVFIMLTESDDRAGGVVIGLLIAVGSVAIASAAAVAGRTVQKQATPENGK